LKVAAVAAVGAPQRRLNHLDFIVLSLYWVAIGYLWNSLTALILPDMIIQFVGRAHEGLAASFLKSLGTLVAILWQPTVGGISDRTITPWGRRRPFIAAGTAGDVVSALLNLGYEQRMAEQAVERAKKDGATETFEDLLRATLQELSAPAQQGARAAR